MAAPQPGSGLAGMEKLANFVAEPDVALLDRVLDTFYRGTPQERALAQPLLTKLQEDPMAWTRVDTILEYSRSGTTKFYALQILESVIRYRWKILPREQCQAIKTYIINLIIKLTATDDLLQREKLVISKLNEVLIHVVKQEWPRNWESFVPEIVTSSATSDSICENNVQILKLLSEEVFDFSGGQLTQAKILELKNTFNKEFSLIFKLLEHILANSQKPSLVNSALHCLLRFLNWIPLGYIFETTMIETLVYKFFPVPMFRNVTLKCLTEIGSLNVGNLHDAHFVKLFGLVMTQLRQLLPVSADIAAAYERGSQEEQNFIEDLSLFFSGFFKAHLSVVEAPDYQQLNLEAHAYLAKITLVSEVEIFKICLEYWNILSADLYNETPFLNTGVSGRRALYAPILSKVRLALIGRMAKPEEVLVVEDDNGEIIREQAKDVDAIILYKSMRETLIYLTHLDCDDTENIMLEKLQNQVNGREWSWHNLNTLCWAVGSISGAMSEDDEKKFLVTVIKDLLGLCEMKKGKDNKAVVASNIMYIVGQYPRFLRAHWKFLKTVVNKLFEFMHELHPGVQDMAADTYCKISQKCRRKFVVTQVGEARPFVDEIVESLQTIISDLQPSQIHTFYEATGYMISAHTDPRARDAGILKLMELPNQSWVEMMAQANRTIDYLRIPETAKSITNILKTNTFAATSLGHCFIVQLGRIFMDLLNVYKVYSETISTQVATGGPYAAASSIVRAMRGVKKETLRLLDTFIAKSEEPQVIYQNFVPPLLGAVLGDYKMIVPETRDYEVLLLLTTIVNKLKAQMIADIPRILDHVFESTLGMITKNFEDYPDHRLHFFNLLRAINQHCFAAFFMIPQQHFKLVIDSIVWGFKHPTRNIAEVGMYILLELWKNIAQSEVAQAFYQAYFLSLLQDIFYVLTDTFHKSAFKLHATMLLQMFHAVEAGQVTAPLWDAAKITVQPGVDNRVFLREYVMNMLATSFKNLSPPQVQGFVQGLFSYSSDLPTFKNHIRDFLVLLKEFSSGDNSELFLEEAEAAKQATAEQQKKKMMSIPGMIAPQDHPGFDLDMNS